MVLLSVDADDWDWAVPGAGCVLGRVGEGVAAHLVHGAPHAHALAAQRGGVGAGHVDGEVDAAALWAGGAEVVGAAKGPKITIMKYKNKTGYRKRQGHRQRYTKVLVTEIKS